MRFLLTLVFLCLPTGAIASNQQQTFFGIAKRVVEGFDAKDWSAVRSATWPDGYYVQAVDHGKTLKRHWENVPMGGVHYRTTFGRPVISVHGRRANIKVSYTVRTYYDLLEPPRACDSGIYHFDLRRRHGEWRVLNLTAAATRSNARCRRSEENL